MCEELELSVIFLSRRHSTRPMRILVCTMKFLVMCALSREHNIFLR